MVVFKVVHVPPDVARMVLKEVHQSCQEVNLWQLEQRVENVDPTLVCWLRKKESKRESTDISL